MISGSAVATSLIFSMAAIGLAYSVEDRVFRERLSDEVALQRASWARSGVVARPGDRDISVYVGDAAVPPDVRDRIDASRGLAELFGREGKIHHVQRFALDASGQIQAVAVLDVSRDALVRSYRDSVIIQLAIIGCLISMVVGLFGWWFVSRALKPLGSLARDVADASAAIPSLQPLDYPSNEIGAVADALGHAFARIRRAVEREQAFTRDASHELRTPLAVIRGAAEVMALHRDLPDHLAAPLSRIAAAGTDMTLALDQLLALARECRGVVKEPVRLLPMVEKAVSWSQLRYPNTNLILAIRIDEAATVMVHPTSLQLVLNNLIGNSFQHLDSGRLLVGLDGAQLSLRDDGPGLDRAANLFEPFAKGHASTGSGLGLDITRRLCDAAGIGLTIDMDGTGGGTRFVLHLGPSQP